MIRRAHILPLVAAAACLLAPLTMLTGVSGHARFAATLAFTCLAPGAALLALLEPPGDPLDPGLTVAASLAFYVVQSELMLALGWWAPTTVTYVVAAASLLAMATRVYRDVRIELHSRSSFGRASARVLKQSRNAPKAEHD